MRPPSDKALRELTPGLRWMVLRDVIRHYVGESMGDDYNALDAARVAVECIEDQQIWDDLPPRDSFSEYEEIASLLRDAADRIDAAIEKRVGTQRHEDKIKALLATNGRTPAEIENGRRLADRLEARRHGSRDPARRSPAVAPAMVAEHATDADTADTGTGPGEPEWGRT